MDYYDNKPDLDPYVDPIALRQANARHDAELRAMGINILNGHVEGKVRSAWNSVKLATRSKLTDKKIAAYTKAGYYSPDYKDARKKLMDKRALRNSLNNANETFVKRSGNFIERDGRLIYAPL